MKIRTQKDVENLDRRIQDELGIDIKKYRDEDIAENLFELINFPAYVINWTLKPILFSFITFLIGFSVIDLGDKFEYIIYAIAGCFLFLSVGGSFGLTLLIRKLKLDIWKILEYTLDLMKSIIVDIDKIKNQITPKSKRNIFTLVFKGIIHLIIIPIWAVAMTEGIPLIGKPIRWLVITIFTFISNQLKIEETIAETELNKSKQGDDFLTKQATILLHESALLKKALSLPLNIIHIPIILYFFVSLLFLSILVFMLNQ